MINLLHRLVDWFEGHKLDRLVCLLVCLVLCGYNWQQTLFLSPDSYTYIRWADLLISHYFNYAAYLRDNTFFTPPVFYLFPVSVIATLKSISADNWQALFQVVNTAALAVCVGLYYRIAMQLQLRRWLIAASLIVLTACADLLVWPHYLLSDMLFAMLVMALLAAHINQAAEKYPGLTVGALTLLVLVARPSSLPFVGAVIAFWLLKNMTIDSRRLLILAISTIIAATTLFVVLVSYGLDYPGNLQVDFITKLASEGVIIHDRPGTWLAPPESLASIATLYFIRMGYFVMPFHHDFSMAHNTMNAVSLGYIITGIVLGAVMGLKKNLLVQHSVLLLILICLLTTLFQAATIIDYDWRYRFPIMLPMTLLATLGFQAVVNAVQRGDAAKS